ncbi:MAG: polysaccharide pyruvyl transferase CsaB [Fimbriimonadales bacterium]
MRLLLVGYYGYRNWGDEGCLASLLQRLPPQACVVLSGDPEFTEQTYGVRAVPRMAFRAVRQAVQEADALVFGGGSLLQDVTSLRSLLYYLMLIESGRRAGKPVWLVGQGMGPFRRAASRWLVRRVLNRLDWISLRDEDSAERLRALGVRTSLRVDADLTWALEPKPPASPLTEGKWVGLAPRAWGDWQVKEAFVALARALKAAGYQPLLVPMQESQDRLLCEQIALEAESPVLSPPCHPAELMGTLARLHAMVAMRLHGAIFALAQAVPTLCVAYDPKVEALARQTEMPLVNPQSLTGEALVAAWRAFEPQIPALQRTLPDTIHPLKERATALLEHLAQHAGLMYNIR